MCSNGRRIPLVCTECRCVPCTRPWTNLVGRAFESLGELDSSALKKVDGWKYLLKNLEKSRDKTQVDLLANAFGNFFLKKDAYHSDGDEIGDYRTRLRSLVRRMEKAPQVVGAESKMPPEVYGWFLVNLYMCLEPSDAANVGGILYKLETPN